MVLALDAAVLKSIALKGEEASRDYQSFLILSNPCLLRLTSGTSLNPILLKTWQ
jgi:hypothetical protein